jgi:pseudomonalisin
MLSSQLNRWSFVFLALVAVSCSALSAQGLRNRAVGSGRIVGPIDDQQVVTVTGNVHPQARGEFDLGAVASDLVLERMVLQLEPSTAQQAELDALVEAQHDPESPLYQQWLTPAEYGARFGVSAADVARISGWLEGHGFTVVEIAPNNRQIQFSGTAAQVADTFHTEIHRYQVNGVEHIANAQDPQIPAAFAGVVSGVVSLHDFRRNSQISSKKALASDVRTPSVKGSPLHGAAPEYSSGSAHYLFPADWATIYDLNSLYTAGTKGSGASIAIVGRSNINASDVTSFRSASGLPANQPTVILVSTNPGLVSGDQDESTLDVEWSGAVAPAATVKFVVGASTSTTDGVDLSAQYIVNHNTAQVVSTSYGSCEQYMGSTELAFYNGLWEQAASEGMSAFVSSGDSGAAGCNGGSSTEGSTTGVNGLCSSPYSTCVGGTEFNEGSNSAAYWSTKNSASEESALSYIPEKVWNESALDGGSGLWASTGGASLVYTQPSWQKGVSGTSAANGMRAVPDVAMAAAGHDGYMIVENGSQWVISGTSAASPSFAGVMALVVQSQSGKGQGNANSGLYALLSASKNPFHATPSGNNSVPGVAGFTASGAAYNLATGLGSVDGALLVSGWGKGGSPTASVNFALTQSVTSGSVQIGKSTTFTVGVSESGSAKNTVTLSVKAPTGVTATISPASITPGTSATVTLTIGSTATAGAQSVTVTGSDSSGTQTLTYALTVTAPPTLTLTAASTSVSAAEGKSVTNALTLAGSSSYSGAVSLSVSGLPTGVTASWSSNPVTLSGEKGTSTLTLTAASTAKVGSATITVTATGDGVTATKQIALQVTQAPALELTLSAATLSMTHTSTGSMTVSMTQLGGLDVPTTLSVTGLPSGVTAALSKVSNGAAGSESGTLTFTGSSSAKAATTAVTIKVSGTSNGTTYTASQTLSLQLK